MAAGYDSRRDKGKQVAKYLLTIRSSGPLDAARSLMAPPDYLVEWDELAAPTTDHSDDGLVRWSIDLQIAGTVADWAKSSAYEALWQHLEAGLRGLELRPRAALTIRSRIDPRRIALTFGYMGDAEVKRARADLQQRIAATVDPATKRLKADVDLRFQG